MKKNNFLIFLIILAGTSLLAQNQDNKRILDLEDNPTGKINRVELPGDNDEIIGILSYRKLENGLTEFSMDYTPINARGLEIEFRKKGRTIYHEEIPGGPTGALDAYKTSDIILDKASYTYDNIREDTWWLGILAVAYCCVEIEIGHNEDGNYYSTITFDCDCISIDLTNSVLNADGEAFNGVDEIVISATY